MPEQQKPTSTWLLCLVTLLMVGTLVSGSLLVWHLTEEVRTSLEARHWPATEGRVTSSALDICSLCDAYSVQVSYQYLVDGRTHSGNKVLFGSISFGSKKDADAFISKYPSGAKVAVYYDPANPRAAVLEPRFAFGVTDFLVEAGIFMMVGIVLYYAVRSVPSALRKLRGQGTGRPAI